MQVSRSDDQAARRDAVGALQRKWWWGTEASAAVRGVSSALCRGHYLYCGVSARISWSDSPSCRPGQPQARFIVVHSENAYVQTLWVDSRMVVFTSPLLRRENLRSAMRVDSVRDNEGDAEQGDTIGLVGESQPLWHPEDDNAYAHRYLQCNDRQ